MDASATATKITRIFHPSDFSAASEVAFAHALKIALVSGADLRMLHVARGGDADWSDFPGVRTTLERWGLIPSGSPRNVVGRLGINVAKVIASSSRPVKACLDFLAGYPADLIVLAIRRHEGRAHWLQKRIGMPVAHRAGQMTLFIPEGIAGFVSLADGTIALRRILIPVARQPRAQPAVDAVARIIKALELAPGEVTLLHVGAQEQAPYPGTPGDSDWTWNRVTTPGEPAEIIFQTAADMRADLIVMTTEGPHGFLDALRGSTSEQVLSDALCPVLGLPANA